MLLQQQEGFFLFFFSCAGQLNWTGYDLCVKLLSSPVSFSFTSSRLIGGIKSEIICFKAYLIQVSRSWDLCVSPLWSMSSVI